ncbi:hypothetical protein HCN44_011054 [Aphidius gifuensis]|uniref:Uncharacterized protein n=1 Tax=Aphidius gifuensis TaxID=684658 RepID=A0A834XYX3_APHGI|nr:hypothetical protein HCN44_011054 [Aphidius gifuensis]
MQVVRRHNDLKKLSLKAVNEEKNVDLNSESTEVDDVPRSGNYIKNNLSATFHDVSLPLMNEITTSTDIPQDPVCLSIDNHPGVLDATSMLIENDLTNVPQDVYLTIDDHPGVSVDATSTSIGNELANSGRSSPVTKGADLEYDPVSGTIYGVTDNGSVREQTIANYALVFMLKRSMEATSVLFFL